METRLNELSTTQQPQMLKFALYVTENQVALLTVYFIKPCDLGMGKQRIDSIQ